MYKFQAKIFQLLESLKTIHKNLKNSIKYAYESQGDPGKKRKSGIPGNFEEASAKLRVAAYCRVSTLMEEQESSYEAQVRHYTEFILRHPDWILAGIYADEGISGTDTRNRDEFNRMIAGCMNGEIDMVITKSISRFARNTMDCLELVRLLTAHNVDIFFEKENLGTEDSGGELLLSILASIAEDESRSISENEKWAIRKRFQKGTFRLSRAPYGYDLVCGEIVVNPEEAEVVRFIFRSILNGKGTTTIAKELNANHVPTKRGGSWHAGTIQSIVHNVFFTGDLLMQKTWKDSQYRVQFNYGEFDQYYMEDHHLGLVSHEVFTAANLACLQRGREKNNHPSDAKYLRNDPHHKRYCFTGKLICGKCGNTLKRQMIYRSDGAHAIWVCRTHLSDTEACPLKRIHEEDIKHAFVTMLNKLAFSKKALLGPYIESLLSPASTQDPSNLQEGSCLDEQKRLILHYSKGRIEPVLFYKRMAALRRGVSGNADVSEPSKDGMRKTIDKTRARFAETAKELSTFLSGWHISKSAFREDVFTQFMDSVRIDSRSRVTFCLKCGSACAAPAKQRRWIPSLSGLILKYCR